MSRAQGDAQLEGERVLAQLLADDPRPVWEVILDQVHTADALARQMKIQIRAGERPVTPDDLDRLVATADRAHRLASATVTTRAAELRAEYWVKQADVDARAIAWLISRVMLRGLEPWFTAALGPVGGGSALDDLKLWLAKELRVALEGLSRQSLRDGQWSPPTDLPPPAPLPASLGELVARPTTPAYPLSVAPVPALPPGPSATRERERATRGRPTGGPNTPSTYRPNEKETRP